MHEWTAINNIRVLCAEMIERARSGHPGAPLALSPMMHILYTRHLQFDPEDPNWPSRDIFILSNGHACAIQYVMLHLSGYDLSMEDLKNFRVLGSKTPGHPEHGITPGVEVTTGPLGQGIANAVGFAIAQKACQEKNKFPIGRVFCVFGDGCYQEGISHEAFSLAGHLKLSNLIFIYDYNQITIDGPVSLSMSDDPILRFKALGFEVTVVENGNDDLEAIDKALGKMIDKPHVIILHTTIGKESELEGSAKCHGSPLGSENLAKLKNKLGFEGSFIIKDEVLNIYKILRKRKKEIRKEWNAKYKKEEINIPDKIINLKKEYDSLSTRQHFFNALNEISFDCLIGGSADLTPSNLTKKKKAIEFSAFESGNYIHYGIREHAMFAIMNGISSFGYHIPFGGTFLNFVTYGFPAVRLAALSKHRVFYVLTHDSIGLGEDGPTHQPIETLALLRATPGLTTLRPCDGVEVRFSLDFAIRHKGPTAICLSRQEISAVPNTSFEKCNRGAYFVIDSPDPELIIISTGSEVALSVAVAEKLKKRVSVVSMISFELFEQQDDTYRQKIIPTGVLKISIEALSTFGWSKYSDIQIGIDKFGKSGKWKDVYDYFDFNVERIIERINGLCISNQIV
ncbi:Transketolase 1 [Astathelohania contejeani]|uniref:transketolase n=1 Tax=Astathelohania contejeani TaxID=164912 RepID=A0ABQ7HZF1_9MICR|nr:Transketolase 1 [Thelohania contejeani]